MLAAMRFALFASMVGCVAVAGVYACGGDGDGFVPGSPDQDDAAAGGKDSGYVFTDGSPVGNSDGGDPTVYPPSSVALGEGFGCLVAADHTVWCWGQNDVGQLGADPAKAPQSCGSTHLPCNPIPTQVDGLEGVLTVAAGKDFACALSGTKIWCWGGNSKNQILGGDSVTSRFTPMMVGEGAGAVLAAGQHACLVTTDGFLHCWGDNTCNLFGRDDAAAISGAFKVPGLPEMRQVSLGEDEICSVSPDDETYCWGSDHKGSLGHDVTGAPLCNGLPFDGTPKRVAAPGTQVTFDNGIEVHVGLGLVCARKTDNNVWCWGDNSRGGLGQGTTDTDTHMFPMNVPAVATADLAVAGQTACAVEAQRSICWGDAQYGQLDSLGSDAGCGGTGCRPLAYVVPNQQPTRQVFLSTDGIATIQADLTFWAWGRNDYGQAGVTPNDPANVTCAGTSVCIPDPKEVRGFPVLF